MCFLLTTPDFLPIDGDLNGYLSGRSTRTFHTPPSYGAERRERELLRTLAVHRTSYSILHVLWQIYTDRLYPFAAFLPPLLQTDSQETALRWTSLHRFISNHEIEIFVSYHKVFYRVHGRNILSSNQITDHTDIKEEENEIVLVCAVLSQNSCV